MNKLILCEGKTDAILLSYYLFGMRSAMDSLQAGT